MTLDFAKFEENVLRFWRQNQIFEKSIGQRKKAKNFVFYEGPPTANGRPGLHHFLARAFKDVICRYKTMAGFKVERKAGWDTHGLPVELEVEKKLGLKNKKEIEKYGISRFNKKCRDSVWKYKKEWEEFTERIGFWLDMKNPYTTYDADYVETLWQIIKNIWQKGFLRQDFKVVPYCPRCGTSLSSHEVAQGYQKIKEPAIYFKLRIKNPEFKDSYLLVWTTTPWTLPGNVAVAVNPNLIYAEVKFGEENLILAKERLKAIGENLEIVRELKGESLIGIQYLPPFYFYQPDYKKEKIWEVIGADFVSLENGSGLVHLAPAFGEEDLEAIKAQNSKMNKFLASENKAQNLPTFPILLTVDEAGRFNLDVKKWAGMFVKEADPLIVADLQEQGILFREEPYEHDYPFCWRCHSPLIYYAKKSWFIRMTAFKNSLLDNNRKINWIPSHLKEGRFGEWLKEIKDWAISRERYWGTPLPVWQCPSCQNSQVIGSLKDLLSQKFSQNNYFVFRHGESLRQIKKIASCWPEKKPLGLTENGEKEALLSAKKLQKEKIDIIFSSDLVRAKQTAEIISKLTGAEIIFDRRLREYNVGIFNGKKPRLVWEYLAKTKNRLEEPLPKGESFRDIKKRMYGFLEQTDKKYRGKNIVIVSHELPLTILEKTLHGLDLQDILQLRKEKKANPIKTGELRPLDFKELPVNEKGELDLHRPYIDKIKFFCPKCESAMQRVQEVIDCWFDSGAMPFAQNHWLGGKPPKLFPADYISEGIDQTRGWFYTLLAVSTLLEFGSPYKNVISLGHVLDEKGEKMSKSKGNVVDPEDIIKRYGADATRWYFYAINAPGEPKLFSEKDIDLSLKKFILTFWNCYVFWETYAKKYKNEQVSRRREQNPCLAGRQAKSQNILDKWIISKLNKLIWEVTRSLDEYNITSSARTIERFTIEDLSLWYIRRSRRRFQKPETEKELREASETLGFVLLVLSKLTAPFIPFLSEEIYQKSQKYDLKSQKSVHLDDWPKVNKKSINEALNDEMDGVRQVVSQALAQRAKAGIKVRQPLNELRIANYKLQNEKELLELIKEEINVKKVIFNDKIKEKIELDTKITPELKEEGMVREFIRNVQEMRKEAGLKPKDKISVRYSGSENLNSIMEKNRELMLREGKIKSLAIRKAGERFNVKKEIKVDEDKLWLGVKKIS